MRYIHYIIIVLMSKTVIRICLGSYFSIYNMLYYSISVLKLHQYLADLWDLQEGKKHDSHK